MNTNSGFKIFLVGMPGSGKTTVGERLAKKMGYEFLDLDALIVKQEGQSIAQLFEQRGQTSFREAESAALRSLEEIIHPLVLATGGGAPCFLDNMTYMQEHGLTVYLQVSAQELVKRLTGEELSLRPLLKNKSKTELLAFLSETLAYREQFYSRANLIIDTEGISLETIIQEVEKQVLAYLTQERNPSFS